MPSARALCLRHGVYVSAHSGNDPYRIPRHRLCFALSFPGVSRLHFTLNRGAALSPGCMGYS